MVNIPALRDLRDRRFFPGWDGQLPQASITASEQAIRSLIDALIALGPGAGEAQVQAAVSQCVERFNELDEGWICTLEREDICDCLGQIVERCGLDASAEWIAENREW